MNKIKLALATAVCSLGLAAPALAYDYQQNKVVATNAAITECVRYTGCSALEFLGNSNGGGECSRWDVRFHTVYYGWLYRSIYVHASPRRSVCFMSAPPFSTY